MAAFRKTFLALAAVVTLTGGVTTAFAQAPFNCTVTTVVPNIRYQGLTEQVGDIIVTCQGGTPTAAGQPVAVNNFAVQILSTNITSKLLGVNLPAANGAYPYTESVLTIDEPYPAAPSLPYPITATVPTASPYGVTQLACPASNTGSCINTGNGNGGGNGPAGAVGSGSYAAAGNFNVFQGYQFDAHTLRFDGIPMDAPGPTTVPGYTPTMIVRITNVRVDATPYAGASLNNQPITATLSITGTQAIAINNISPYVVAYPANGITMNATPGNSPVCNPPGAFTVTAREGFASAFRRQNVALSADGISVPAPAPQNILGAQYFTESGFFYPAIPGGPTVNYNAGLSSVGLATQGTRIWISLTNIPKNITVHAPTIVYLYGGTTANRPTWVSSGPSLPDGTPASGEAHLVHTADGTGGGAYSAGSGADATYGPGTADGGAKTFTYEVLYSDSGTIETMYAGFTVTYAAGVPTYTVPPTNIVAAGSLAPVSPTPNNVASVVTGAPTSDSSVPRFILNPGSIANVFYLTGCQCDLLFPYVVSQNGLETGMAIANTSLDPYGTVPQSGYIQLFYYPDFGSSYTGLAGTTAPGAPFSQTTANKLNGGDEFLMVLGGGSANPGFNIAGTPGFQGYIIAVSGFQYCHGYAFISDSAVQKLAEGYVALQLDDIMLPRFGGSNNPAPGISPPAYVPGESLGH